MVLTRLARPFSWVFVGHAGFLASQWLMLVVLAKGGSPQFVGSFALALAISSPVILASGLNFRYVIAADTHRQYAFRDFLGLRLIALGVALLLFTATGLFGPIGRTTGLTLVFVGIARVFWAFSDVYYGLFLRRERTWAIAASLLLRAVLGLAGVAIGLWLTGSVVGAAAGMAAGWLAPIFLVDLPVAARLDPDGQLAFHPRWDKTRLRRLFYTTVPLGILAVLVNVTMHMPKYLVGFQLGADDLGYFAAMATLIVPGLTVVNSLTQTAVPQLSDHLKRGDTPAFTRTVTGLLGVAVGLGLAGLLLAWLAGDWILATFYEPAYAAHLDALLWLVVGGIFLFTSWVLDAVLTAMGHFDVQPWVAGIGVLIALTAGLWLIPTSGLVGAAVSWGLAFLVVTGVKGALVGYYARAHDLDQDAATNPYLPS